MTCINKRPCGGRDIGTIFLLLFLLLTGCHHQDSVNTEVAKQVQQHQSFLDHTQQAGVLSTSDHTRLLKIQTILEQSHQMSDADLDFWVELLHRGPLKNDPVAWSGFHTLVLEDALGHKELSLPQRTKMYDAVLPYVSDAAYAKDMDPTDQQMSEKLRSGNEQIAVMLLAQTRESRALGMLAQIAQSNPSPEIRQTAQNLHEKLLALPK